MTVRGHVKNGVVLLDGPEKLADGIEVSIRPLKGRRRRPSDRKLEEPTTSKEPTARYKRYERFIGKVEDLPPDFSINLDHYLYGAPKVKE